MLSVAGGAAGVALATLGAQGASSCSSSQPADPLTISAWPDARLLAINVCGQTWPPAWRSGWRRPGRALSVAMPGPVLKAEGSGVLGGPKGPPAASALVVAQVAVSLLLMLGAGVFLKSLDNLLAHRIRGSRPRSCCPSPSRRARSDTSRPKPRRSPRRCSTACAPRPASVRRDSSRTVCSKARSWNSNMTIEGRAYDPERAGADLQQPHQPRVFRGHGDSAGQRPRLRRARRAAARRRRRRRLRLVSPSPTTSSSSGIWATANRSAFTSASAGIRGRRRRSRLSES